MLPPAPRWLPAVLGLQTFSASIVTWTSLRLALLTRTPAVGLRATLLWDDLILTNYICDPVGTRIPF